MLQQLGTTLETLAYAEDADDGLYFFRAMFHYED